ncbi:MAG: Fe-S cluster assembly protein IscX [bacterium]|nr:Fe-S cluster assembly protein IscX [bacterium]
MNINTFSNKLYWESSFEIVLALIETYPDVDVEAVGEAELVDLVVSLPDFVDDPTLVNEGIVKDILREWYEEVNS